MRTVICIALLTFGMSATAQTPVPMKSFSFKTDRVHCAGDNSDQLLPFERSGGSPFAPPALPGAGIMPNGSFKIRKVCLTHWIEGAQNKSFAVVGHSGLRGDHISPQFAGSDTRCMDFTADAPVFFEAGEYLDIHAGCDSGYHWAVMQIWFTD